jgi:hypothetical protein
VQRSAGGKDALNKKILSQAAFVFDCPVALNTPDGMFHSDPERRNQAAVLFLFRC